MNKEIKIEYTFFKGEYELSQIEKDLYSAAKNVRKQAHAPYSNFYVGCAVLLQDGTITKGSNQENAVYPAGTCAERVALNWTSANYPKEEIKKIFIVGAPNDIAKNIKPVPPCGICRQTISEYEDKQQKSIEVFFASTSGEIYMVNSVKLLLPFTFGSDFL